MLAARSRAHALPERQRSGGGRIQAARRRAGGVAGAGAAAVLERRRSRRSVAAGAINGSPGNNAPSNGAIDPLALISRAPAALAEAAAAADPVLGAAAREPAAFLGGAFAALLQLDDSRDPLREWIERTREAAGLPPTDQLDYGEDSD